MSNASARSWFVAIGLAAALGFAAGSLVARRPPAESSPENRTTAPSSQHDLPRRADAPGEDLAPLLEKEQDLIRAVALREAKVTRAGGPAQGDGRTDPAPEALKSIDAAGRHRAYLEAYFRSELRAKCRRLQRELGLSDAQLGQVEAIMLPAAATLYQGYYGPSWDGEAVEKLSVLECSLGPQIAAVLNDDQRRAFDLREESWGVLASVSEKSLANFIGQLNLSQAERSAVSGDLRTWWVGNSLIVNRAVLPGERDEETRMRFELTERILERLGPKLSPQRLEEVEGALRRTN